MSALPPNGVPVCCSSPQGVVCTLHEGDDFGKLALVNDSPRAASIVLHEDNCHFLRVDKEDFNRILRVSPAAADWGGISAPICQQLVISCIRPQTNSHGAVALYWLELSQVTGGPYIVFELVISNGLR